MLTPIAPFAELPWPGEPIDLAQAQPGYLPPPSVIAAIEELVATRGLGYPTDHEKAAFEAAFRRWQLVRHGWIVGDHHVGRFAGATQALAAVTRALTPLGGSVVAHDPTYPGIEQVVTGLGRRLVRVPIAMSAHELASVLATAASRLLIVCNPHNPTGTSFDAGQLHVLASAAQEAGAVMVADEVHADFAHLPHVPLASLAGNLPVASIVSPGKTLAMAGLGAAVLVGAASVVGPAVAASPRLLGYASVGAVVAATAGWTDGELWLEALRNVVDENRRVLGAALTGTGLLDEAEPNTFLSWIDVSATGRSSADIVERSVRKGVKVTDGGRFGPAGIGHIRVCLARPPTWFAAGVDRLISNLIS